MLVKFTAVFWHALSMAKEEEEEKNAGEKEEKNNQFVKRHSHPHLCAWVLMSRFLVRGAAAGAAAGMKCDVHG